MVLSFTVPCIPELASMEKKPAFVRNNEEWIVWLLAGEFGTAATPAELVTRTTLPLDIIHDNFLYLERVGILSIDRDPAKQYPDEIALVRLTSEGLKLYEDLKLRPDIGDDDLF
jgi:hypothetical protein